MGAYGSRVSLQTGEELAQGPYRRHGVFGLSKWEYTVAGHRFRPVGSLLRAQAPHYKHGIFGPVTVGAYVS